MFLLFSLIFCSTVGKNSMTVMSQLSNHQQKSESTCQPIGDSENSATISTLFTFLPTLGSQSSAVTGVNFKGDLKFL